MKPSSNREPQPETISHERITKTSQPPFMPSEAIPLPVHQSDADEEDENVKQLGDCSAVYLALQDCLIKTNRNWKSCQAGMVCFHFSLPFCTVIWDKLKF